jgi:hypothetical protein
MLAAQRFGELFTIKHIGLIKYYSTSTNTKWLAMIAQDGVAKGRDARFLEKSRLNLSGVSSRDRVILMGVPTHMAKRRHSVRNQHSRTAFSGSAARK